ncbi:hypothetical protein B0T11DRAFT_109005 [Plectosphaerella cucumerina]|jgi:hypothetical protein|uniref:Uncharacterized protein n=1 Tax=Plectosphaerella cucumerina TaxID=40658 RepID=A0A8K0TFZ0_9PEZI|nr:hypothetical protein B0T11DRAFT_109005 [Plectosphaerella cucumerina]
MLTPDAPHRLGSAGSRSRVPAKNETESPSETPKSAALRSFFVHREPDPSAGFHVTHRFPSRPATKDGCLHAAAGRCRDESAAARLRAYLRVVVVHDVAISPVIAHKSNLGALSIVSQGPSIEAYNHLGRRAASISRQACATRRAMPVSPPCQSAADRRRNRHTASRRRQRRLPLFNVPVSGPLTGPRSAGRRQAFFLPPPCRSRG